MWNAKRTPAQIRESMFTAEYADGTSGLVEQWLFNEGTGTTVAGTNPTSAGTYAAGAGKYWDGDSEENWTGSDAGGWAASGTFTQGTSTLVFNGTDCKMYFKNDEQVKNLTINSGKALDLYGIHASPAT